MKKKSIKKNYIFNLLYQIILLITPFITTPYLSRVLGPDGVGTVSYAESIVSYFTLFGTLGITTYGNREISYVQDNIEKRSIIFWNTKILQICTASIALLAYIIFSFNQENMLIYLVLSLNLFAVIVDVSWFLQGMEEFGKIVFRNLILRIANIAYVFVFIRTKEDVVIYAFGLAFFLFIGHISLWGYLPKYLCRVNLKEIRPFKDINIVISLFIPTIAIQIYTVLDKTMIGLITGDVFENGYYEQASKISKMALPLVTALGTVVIPRIGFHFQNNEHDEVKRIMYRGYRFVWFLGLPLTLGLCVVTSNFVPWFFGAGYEKVQVLLPVLAFLILAIGINNVTGMQYLIPTKRQNLFTFTVIIGAVVNLVLNVILIPIFQSVGAAIASVTAETIIAIVQIFIVRKELNPSIIIKQGANYFIAGTVMSIVLFAINKSLVASMVNTVILIMIGAIVYFITLFILRDEFLITNLKTIYKKVRRKV